MRVARAWGCTPAQLRAVTRAEYREMVDQLVDEAERRAAAAERS